MLEPPASQTPGRRPSRVRSGPAKRGSRTRRWIRRGLLGALSCWVLYVAAVAVFLNTPLAYRAVNRKPDTFQIHWRFAISPWPGYAYLQGVAARGQSQVIRWSVDLDSVATSFEIGPLFSRTVHLDWVKAEGARYRQRRLFAPGVDPGPLAAGFPPIEDLASPSDSDREMASPGKPRTEPWTIEAESIDCGLREIWLNSYRLEGEMRTLTRMSLTVHGPLELGQVKFEGTSLELWSGEEQIFEEFSLRTDLHFEPFNPKGHAPADVVRALTGDLVLESSNANLGLLELYMQKIPWLEIRSSGPFAINLRLEKGTLAPGTHFRLERDPIDIHFLDRRLTGAGHLEANVVVEEGRPACKLSGRIDRFEVAVEGESRPFASGSGFRMEADSAVLSLVDPFTDIRVVVDLPEAQIPDLSIYNGYFPSESRLSIVSGAGRFGWHIEGSAEEHSMHGDISVAMDDVHLKFESTELSGDIKIATKLNHGSAKDKHFDISGTRIDFSHAETGWVGHVLLHKSEMWFTQPARVDARLELALQDTTPIVMLFDAYHDVPRWVENLMLIENVAGTGSIDVAENQIDVADLDITGKGLRALADITFSQGGRSGILYIRFHGFSLGLEQVKGERDFKLVRPFKWFQQRRAARKLAPAGAP